MSKRNIFIGDIHGCFNELQALLTKVHYNKDQDDLYLLGDVINKGPKNQEVLEFIEQERPFIIKGNHEFYFLKYCHGQTDLKSQSFEKLKKELQPRLNHWLELIDSWPYFIEREHFLCIHAGIPPLESPLKSIDPELLTNIRTWDGSGESLSNPKNPPWHELYQNSKLVIYGHWAQQGLLKTHNTIGLDSGCVYGGKLSALILPSKEIVQVQAKEIYCPIKSLNVAKQKM